MYLIQAFWRINNDCGWVDYAPYGKNDGAKALLDFSILKEKGNHDRYRLLEVLNDTEID